MGVENNWIEWSGGERPVPRGALIIAECRDRREMLMGAADLRWTHQGDYRDIVRYRVVEHPAPVEPRPATGVNATLAERGSRYGAFRDNAGVAQSIKAILDGHPRWHTLTACQRESLHHIASKIARIMNGDSNYLDNWHDIACYAMLVEKDINEGARNEHCYRGTECRCGACVNRSAGIARHHSQARSGESA